MGILFRYDYIEEGLSNPIILSFRIVLEISETFFNQLNKQIASDQAPSTRFISHIMTKKSDDVYQLLISVNLHCFYEKWSDDFNYTYLDIIRLLQKKIRERFGDEFAEYISNSEKFDCDFIEYSFIARGRDEIRDMQECYASSDQITKVYWDDYLENSKEKYSKKRFYKDEELIDFLPCCIEYCHSDYAHNADTNSLESYNSCHNDFYECYVRCNGEQLQRFSECLDKIDFVGRKGVLLKYLFDDNFKRTLCQCAFEHNCRRSCSSDKTVKLIYEEFCKEFGNPLESEGC